MCKTSGSVINNNNNNNNNPLFQEVYLYIITVRYST